MTIALFAVWVFLVGSTGLMLLMSKEASSTDDIQSVVALSVWPILAATIINEFVVDRCWRRVTIAALGKFNTYNAAQLQKNIRAANFEWLNIWKRLWTHELSFMDFRALLSYIILRWGTAVSIASMQFAVNWTATEDSGTYVVDRRRFWLVGPVIIHGLSITCVLVLWLLPPWSVFSGHYDDMALLEHYRPYLDHVPGGSIATYDDVARFLDPKGTESTDRNLRKQFRPGLQFRAKLKGIWFGILCAHIPPVLASFYKIRSLFERNALFFVNLTLLAQNICYILALDFVVWNLSLEGLCKDKGTRLKKTMRHFGTNSGIMLLIKALRQRRPWKVAFFFWLFWLQACVIRALAFIFIVDVKMDKYDPKAVKNDFYGLNGPFWIGYTVITSGIIVPLFVLWLLIPQQAPVCSQDGWRWARIAQVSLFEEGNYGVENNQARWGRNVCSFKEWDGTALE